MAIFNSYVKLPEGIWVEFWVEFDVDVVLLEKVTRPGKRLQITKWKDPPFLMGQLTISMAIFNSYVKLPEGRKSNSQTFFCWVGMEVTNIHQQLILSLLS